MQILLQVTIIVEVEVVVLVVVVVVGRVNIYLPQSFLVAAWYYKITR